jgi:hypothetical protein
MKLKELKEKIQTFNTDKVLTCWENDIQVAFHQDSGLYLDSELFEIMGVETKENVIELIDMLITKTKEMKGE